MARYDHSRFSAQIDLSQDIGSLAVDLAALGSRVDKVIARAMKKTHRWLVTHSSREIGKELGIKQGTLKRRFQIDSFHKKSVSFLSLWVGLMPVAVHEMRRSPRQNRRGVRAGGRQFDGAFYKTVYGSEDKVWIRTSRNRREGHTTVANRPGQRGGYDLSFMTDNSGRFPVQIVGVDIDDVALPILERYSDRVAGRFRTILKQELHYELYVRNK